MTLTKEDVQTIKGLLDDVKLELLAEVDRKFTTQNFTIDRRIRAEAIKLASEFRKQLSDLKETMGRVVKETFDLVYHDHPTKQEVESQIDDVRDETDRRFETQEERISLLEEAQQTT